MELPLAERELTRSAKRRSTYMLRLAPVALTCVVVGWTWLWGLTLNTSLERAAGEMGSFLANLARVFQYFAVFAVGPLLTAGLIAQEKQERTLSLLLMADFRGWDLFLAKFVSAFLQVELLILSMLPLLAIASFLGGVSVPEAALQILLLSLAALATCSLGLLSSTVSKRPIDAFLVTLLLVFLWISASVVSSAFFGVAWGTSLNIVHTAWSPSSTPWVASAVFTALLAAGTSLLAIKLLPRQAHEGAKRPRASRRRALPSVSIPFVSRGRRKVEPVAELLFAGGGDRMFGGSRVMRAFVGVFLVFTGLTCGGVVILIAALYDITTSLATRQSAVMDDLMTTPVEGEEFARSLLRAQRVRCRLYLPAVIAVALRGFGSSRGFMAFGFVDDLPLLVVGSATILLLNAIVIAPLLWRFIVALGCKASTWPYGVTGQTTLGVVTYGALHFAFSILAVPSFFIFTVAVPQSNSDLGKVALSLLAVLLTTILLAGAYRGVAASWERDFVRRTSDILRGRWPVPGSRPDKPVLYL